MNKKEEEFLIIFNSIPYFLKYFDSKSVTATWVLKEISFPLKVLRKITRLLKLPQTYWYGDWKRDLNSIDTVIIFAPIKEVQLIRYIKNSHPNIKIIYWYWNPVFRIGQLNSLHLNDSEVWSFDPLDCKQNNMKFNTTFYFKKISLPLNKIEYDAVFVGRNKGRAELLNKLEIKLRNKNLNPYFYVIPDYNPKGKKYAQKIPYSQYLELVSKSKTIIDISPDKQTGLTLRPMESIFLKKKLITSDETIINQDFYDKRNIFILGKDNDDELHSFINSPYKDISQDIVDGYDVKNWLKRFN